MSRRENRAALQQAARERLECLRAALAAAPAEDRNVVAEEMTFRRAYLEETCRVLEQLAAGQPADYAALCESITLEMIANSRGWFRLRYCARQMCR